MSEQEITLVLSGTQMSGFRYGVDREWALDVTKEELINVIRHAMIDLAKKHDMYHLLKMATNARLHIHAEYDNNTKEIYICECPQNRPEHSDHCDSNCPGCQTCDPWEEIRISED